MTTFPSVNRRYLRQGRRSAPAYSPFPDPPPPYEPGLLSTAEVRGVFNHIRETHALRERAKIQKCAVLYIQGLKLVTLGTVDYRYGDPVRNMALLERLQQFVYTWTNPRLCIFTSKEIP